MINYIRGKLVYIGEDNIVVECNNIGYQIYIPNSLLEHIPSTGKEIKIFTYLEHKEDALTLYGFLNKNQVEAFKILLSVSGIGPKIALSALSLYTPEDIYEAILNEDVSALCRIPGIGKKTAKRIVLEIKDKINKIITDASEERIRATDVHLSEIDKNAIKALQALGYSYKEAIDAVRSIDKEIKKKHDLNVIIKYALKNLDNF